MMNVKNYRDASPVNDSSDRHGNSKLKRLLSGISWGKFVVSLAVPLGVGALVGLAIAPSIESTLNSAILPPLMPPRIVFPIVWTALYTLMGIAFYLVWMSDSSKKKPFVTYFIQLALNAAWPILFFSLAQFDVAAVVILALMVAIALCMESFLRANRLAGKLFIPYLVWTAFAVYLNLSIALMN